MSQANVYTSASAQTWYTDKARISTGNTAVTFQVEAESKIYDFTYGGAEFILSYWEDHGDLGNLGGYLFDRLAEFVLSDTLVLV